MTEIDIGKDIATALEEIAKPPESRTEDNHKRLAPLLVGLPNLLQSGIDVLVSDEEKEVIFIGGLGVATNPPLLNC